MTTDFRVFAQRINDEYGYAPFKGAFNGYLCGVDTFEACAAALIQKLLDEQRKARMGQEDDNGEDTEIAELEQEVQALTEKNADLRDRLRCIHQESDVWR